MTVLLPSSKTQMIICHGKHSRSFITIYIVAVLILFSVDINICSSLEEEWWPDPACNSTATYRNGSKFVNNVKTALNSLHVDIHKDTSNARFNTCVYGQSPNQIYALLQCRGDAIAEECYNCSQAAKVDVLKYCGNYVGSRVWSKFCFLRYNGNYNFTGKLDTDGGTWIYPVNASFDPAAYAQSARQLLSNLSSEIISGSARNRFASGSTVDSGQFHNIYGLAQCLEDIPLDQCESCLSTKIDQLFETNTGYLGARALAGSCVVRYESKPFFNPSPPPPQHHVASPSPPPQPHVASPSPPKNSPRRVPIIAGVLGGLLLLFIIVFVFGTRRRLKYAIFGRRGGGHHIGHNSRIKEGEQPTSEGQVLRTCNVFTVFKMETLVTATENFHDNNKLGEGGFGAVYKGTTPEGSVIAVKKLSLKSMQGKNEFLNEVELLAKIQHRNLVKLLGCCVEGSERLLVYEYLPNKSLDKILFDRNKRRQLDWQKRYNIILGITRGLLYLHEDSHLRIIHRDIKAGNILLDSKLNPKIADFGLARLFDEDDTYVRTMVAGTRGYMAPEYVIHGHLSVKADVYSFGILLLEVISGRKNIDFNLSLEMQILLEWAWGLYKRRNIVDMIDPAIMETCSDEEQEQALRCIHVGLLCTQGSASLRPSMSTVNIMLSTDSMTLPDPTAPAFVSSVAIKGTNNSGSSHGQGSSHASSSTSSYTPLPPPSNADASITVLEPR